MARRGIRKKDYERLDDSTLSRVVSLLEQDKPITKKAACEILNISYSVQRLNRIVQEYKDKIEFRKRRMAQNRGKPFNELELKELVVDYLSGKPISKIAQGLFRSERIVKNKIKELNLPERDKNTTYHNPGIIPDTMVSKEFEPGELVWSARYNSVAEIMKNMGDHYRIYVFGKGEQYACQPWWELGKLPIFKKLNIKETEFQQSAGLNIIYRID